jgi:hypothetical protein
MDIILKVLIGFILAISLHELTHLIVILHYKIPIKAIILTNWTAFGFLVDNKSYMNNEKIMVLLYFSPLIWCLLLFINPYEMFFIMFPLVNIFGGLGDIYFYIKLKSLSPQKRIEWANNFDKKIYKSTIWKKDL